MENNRSDELYHYGRKGMKWYQNIYTSAKNVRTNRKRKQSLEKAREVKKQKADEAKRKAAEAETVEAKRDRLLKSTNAQELYENRHLLTTAEINERISRIDTEVRLANIAAKTKTTGRDRVNKVMEAARMANDLYEVTQKPVVKALKKQIMGEKESPKKISDLENALKNINNLSDDEVAALSKRANNVSAIKRALSNDSNGKNSGVSQDVIDDILRELEELKNNK